MAIPSLLSIGLSHRSVMYYTQLGYCHLKLAVKDGWYWPKTTWHCNEGYFVLKCCAPYVKGKHDY